MPENQERLIILLLILAVVLSVILAYREGVAEGRARFAQEIIDECGKQGMHLWDGKYESKKAEKP